MKKIIAILLVLVLTFSLCACGADGGEEKTYTMTIGHVMSEGHPRTVSLEQFEKDVEEKTNGQIQVEIVGDSALGNEKELLEQVLGGQIQGMRGGQMDYTNRLYAFSLPFLANTGEEITALLNSEVGVAIANDAAELTGHTIINVCNSGGFRNFSNNVKEVKVPADIKGLKMRAPGIDTIVWTLEALDANVTSVAYGDLYQALKTGLADGQENPWSNVATMKFYEPQKYFTEVRYQFHPDAFGVNTEWWNSLTPELQEIVSECASDMGKLNDKLCDESDASYKQVVLDYGCEVYVPTAEELKLWQEACSSVYDTAVEAGLVSQDEVDAMLKIVADMRK